MVIVSTLIVIVLLITSATYLFFLTLICFNTLREIGSLMYVRLHANKSLDVTTRSALKAMHICTFSVKIMVLATSLDLC